jgi:hypothetical protein
MPPGLNSMSEIASSIAAPISSGRRSVSLLSAGGDQRTQRTDALHLLGVVGHQCGKRLHLAVDQRRLDPGKLQQDFIGVLDPAEAVLEAAEIEVEGEDREQDQRNRERRRAGGGVDCNGVRRSLAESGRCTIEAASLGASLT